MMSHHVYDEEVRGEFERVLNELVLNGKHVPGECSEAFRVTTWGSVPALGLSSWS